MPVLLIIFKRSNCWHGNINASFYLIDDWLVPLGFLCWSSHLPDLQRLGLAFELACLPNLITAQGFRYYSYVNGGFPGSSDGKESACNAGDLGLIPGLGRSPGEGSGNTLQYSCLENSMDRPWGRKELDMTEQLPPSLTHMLMNQIASIHWIIEKAREFQKNVYLCFIDYT